MLHQILSLEARKLRAPGVGGEAQMTEGEE
jgi:hypothetical protein